MFPKNKQNKLRKRKKDEIKEESHLNNAIIIKNTFCFLVCLFFYHINLLNIHKNVSYFICCNHGIIEESVSIKYSVL